MTSVFISYRRSESAGHAQAISNVLEQWLGSDHVFMDVDDISPGDDFPAVLDATLARVDVLFALIGPTWLEASNEASGTRRIDDQGDFVRREIAAALDRGIRVIPILVDGETMPRREDLPEPLQRLADKQAVSLRHGRFVADLEDLIDSVPELRAARASAKKTFLSARGGWRWALVGVALAVAASVGTVTYVNFGPSSDRDLRRVATRFEDVTFSLRMRPERFDFPNFARSQPEDRWYRDLVAGLRAVFRSKSDEAIDRCSASDDCFWHTRNGVGFGMSSIFFEDYAKALGLDAFFVPPAFRLVFLKPALPIKELACRMGATHVSFSTSETLMTDEELESARSISGVDVEGSSGPWREIDTEECSVFEPMDSLSWDQGLASLRGELTYDFESGAFASVNARVTPIDNDDWPDGGSLDYTVDFAIRAPLRSGLGSLTSLVDLAGAQLVVTLSNDIFWSDKHRPLAIDLRGKFSERFDSYVLLEDFDISLGDGRAFWYPSVYADGCVQGDADDNMLAFKRCYLELGLARHVLLRADGFRSAESGLRGIYTVVLQFPESADETERLFEPR